MILYTHNNKLIKIGSGPNAGKLIEKYVAPPPPSFDEVTIGSQTWMAKNLAIDDGGEGIVHQTVNYGQGDVVEYYYNWDAAVRVAASIPGWHLPSHDEWNTLATTAGGSSTAGTKLKSTYGWNSGNGTDDYRFAAFPAGAYAQNSFIPLGYISDFWSRTLYSSEYAIFSEVRYDSASIQFSAGSTVANSYSVRLIKDS